MENKFILKPGELQTALYNADRGIIPRIGSEPKSALELFFRHEEKKTDDEWIHIYLTNAEIAIHKVEKIICRFPPDISHDITCIEKGSEIDKLCQDLCIEIIDNKLISILGNKVCISQYNDIDGTVITSRSYVENKIKEMEEIYCNE